MLEKGVRAESAEGPRNSGPESLYLASLTGETKTEAVTCSGQTQPGRHALRGTRTAQVVIIDTSAIIAAGIELAPVDADQAHIARQAFRQKRPDSRCYSRERISKGPIFEPTAKVGQASGPFQSLSG